MRTITSEDILHIWQTGRSRHPIDRALTILSAGMSDEDRHKPASLRVGERDKQLLLLRRNLFGDTMPGMATCPQCTSRLEFDISIKNILEEVEQTDQNTDEITIDEYSIRIRYPNSYDLAAIAGDENHDNAIWNLMKRCISVSAGVRENDSIDVGDLPAPVLEKISRELETGDPFSSISFLLACPDCRHRWKTILDIGAYFWEEIRIEAIRLLRDIHLLARSYGWTEKDILSIPPERRQLYLDMITA